MTPDPTLDEESYATFLIEAQDLLQRIEQDLLSLREDRSPTKVHQLMRSAHTLKGAAASVELDVIKQIAHVLEDIFKALYNPDVVVDAEVEDLLFQAYECLRFPLMAELTGKRTEAQEFLDRAASIIAQLQERWGDCFDREAPLPNSAELGFDVVQSLFEVGVQQRLQELRQALDSGNSELVLAELQTKAEIFLGLAESLDLPGFGSIAQTVLTALEAHPDQALTIAALALENFVQGQALILEGDRTQGGNPSSELQALAGLEPLVQVSEQEPDSETVVAVEAEAPVTSLVGIETSILSLDDVFGDDAFGHEAVNEVTATEEILEPEAEIETSAASTELSVPHSTAYTVSGPVNSAESYQSEPIEIPVAPASSAKAAEPQQSEPARVELVRVAVEQLKKLDYSVGEMLINQNQQATQDQDLRVQMQTLRSSLHQHQQTLYTLQDCVEKLIGQLEQGTQLSLSTLSAVGASSLTPAAAPSFTSSFDTLEMERYHDLRVLVRSTLNEVVQLDETAETVEQITKQSRRTRETQRRLLLHVRDDLTSLRMHPLQDLLNRFPRLLQQLTQAQGKPVELVLKNTQLLVDKVIAEKLYDPLLHLIRNAFDHGIEAPDVRRAQGKSEIGKIEIRASQQGNYTLIEVKDDGQGINFQQVAQRAIALNLATHEQISTMSEAQLLDLIFQPGFSTTSDISDLSGRGIGLDAVNSQLQTLNGSIAVSTAPQQGTTFSLKIPLSLTTTKLLVCKAQEFAYALPLDRIEQIIVPIAGQLQVSNDEQLVLHWKAGQEECIVPVYLLSELVRYSPISFQVASAARTTHHLTARDQLSTIHQRPSASILLLQTIYGRRALMVDQVLGEQELVIRALGTAITPPPYIYGCCVLGSHRSALAIDIEVLMQLTTEVELLSESYSLLRPSQPQQLTFSNERSTPFRQLTGQDKETKRSHTKYVLVVDDSLTIRRHLMTLFERAGYSVLQAGDGLEALAQLETDTNINGVICDIEMPNLNGFEFLSHVKRNPTLADIPVVVLTSRSSAKHRQIAQELGAAAYFTKPCDHNQLLTTIDHLIKQST
ncbi:MAG TPA: hybrid sensor histidine kinase/response regulator [Leptolyngbyaceae cyanobacterium]